MTDLIARLEKAEADHAQAVSQCPLNSPRMETARRSEKQCVRCDSSSSGPCWVSVQADSVFHSSVAAILKARAQQEVGANG